MKTFLLSLMVLCLGVSTFFLSVSSAAGGAQVAHQELDHPAFDGNRYEMVNSPLGNDMDEWTLAARLRPDSDDFGTYVANEVQGENGKIALKTVTSIDFCNGQEIITSLGNDVFVYRDIGGAEWKESRIELFKPHSITWSDQLGRYFVADTENHRVISFAELGKSLCDTPNDPGCNCAPGDLDCQPYSQIHYVAPGEDKGYLCRPHDLEYNPVDGYFYGVTAPWEEDPYCDDNNSLALSCQCLQPTTDSNGNKVWEHTYLFRFTDITENGDIVDGEFIDLKDLGIENGRYTRSVTIAENVAGVPDGRVYVVDSEDGTQGVYEIVNFSPSGMERDTDYYFYQYPSGNSTLNDIEYFDGWWYGTSDGTTLFRWKTWGDFENNRQIVIGSSGVGYFLSQWDDTLFIALFTILLDSGTGVYYHPAVRDIGFFGIPEPLLLLLVGVALSGIIALVWKALTRKGRNQAGKTQE